MKLRSDEARLAYASNDGTVSFVPVRQAKASSGKQTISLGKVQLLDEGDQRTVTCLRWLGVREVRLILPND